MKTSRSASSTQGKRKNKDKDPLSGDLSSLFDGTHPFRQVSFELRPKNKVISLRMSEDLFAEIKRKAKKLGIDYQKYIRIVLERAA